MTVLWIRCLGSRIGNEGGVFVGGMVRQRDGTRESPLRGAVFDEIRGVCRVG